MNSTSPLFADLDDAAIDEARAAFQSMCLDAGAVLIRQSDTTDAAYVLESGEVDVIQNGATVATLGPGTVLGELGLLTLAPRSARVVARTAVQVSRLDRDAFDTLCTSSNPVAGRIERRAIHQLTRRYAQQVDSLTAAAFTLPSLVVQAGIEPSDGIVVPMEHSGLAALLATELESVDLSRRHASTLARGAVLRVFGRDEYLVESIPTLHILMSGSVFAMAPRPERGIRDGLVHIATTEPGRLFGGTATGAGAQLHHVMVGPTSILSLDPEVIESQWASDGRVGSALRRAVVGSVFRHLQSSAALLSAAHFKAVDHVTGNDDELRVIGDPQQWSDRSLVDLWTTWDPDAD